MVRIFVVVMKVCRRTTSQSGYLALEKCRTEPRSNPIPKDSIIRVVHPSTHSYWWNIQKEFHEKSINSLIDSQHTVYTCISTEIQIRRQLRFQDELPVQIKSRSLGKVPSYIHLQAMKEKELCQ